MTASVKFFGFRRYYPIRLCRGIILFGRLHGGLGRFRRSCLLRLGRLDGGYSPSCVLNLFLLKWYFRSGTVHLIGRHNEARAFRRFNPGLAANPPFPCTTYLLLYYRSSLFLIPLNDCPIILDPVDHCAMRFLIYRDIRIVVPMSVALVIVDHPVIDDGRGKKVVDDDGGVYIGHTYTPVIIHTIKIALRDYDGTVCVGIIPGADIDPPEIGVGNHDVTGTSPVTVTVVGLAGRQRYPTHIRSAVNP